MKKAALETLLERISTFTQRILKGENIVRQAPYMADELISLCFNLATGHRHLYQIILKYKDGSYVYIHLLESSWHGAKLEGDEMALAKLETKVQSVKHITLIDLLKGGVF